MMGLLQKLAVRPSGPFGSSVSCNFPRQPISVSAVEWPLFGSQITRINR